MSFTARAWLHSCRPQFESIDKIPNNVVSWQRPNPDSSAAGACQEPSGISSVDHVWACPVERTICLKAKESVEHEVIALLLPLSYISVARLEARCERGRNKSVPEGLCRTMGGCWDQGAGWSGATHGFPCCILSGPHLTSMSLD